MRKKLEPGVEGWVARGIGEGRLCGGGKSGMEENDDMGEEDDDEEMGEGGEVRGWRQLWESAPVVGNEEARRYDWGGVGEEGESSEEDGEGEREKEEKGRERGVGVDGWLRVLSKGEVGR